MPPRTFPLAILSSRHLLARARSPVPIAAAIRAQSTAPQQPGVRDKDPQIGDYPNLPWVNAQTRAPTGWTDQQDRRNFGEPLHEQDEVLGVWSPDLHAYSPYKALFQVGVFAVAMTGFAFYIYNHQLTNPALPRTYPYNGLTQELGGLPGDVKQRIARIQAVEESVEETAEEIVGEGVEKGVDEGAKEGVEKSVEKGVEEGVKEGEKEDVNEGEKEGEKEGKKEDEKEGEKEGKEGVKEGEKEGVEEGSEKDADKGVEKSAEGDK